MIFSPFTLGSVTRYMYSTPSPSIPSSPHLAQIIQLDQGPQESLILFLTLVQQTSIGSASVIPVGLSLHSVPPMRSSVSGINSDSFLLSSLLSFK